MNDSSLAYIEPLETRETRGLIKCAAEIEEASDKPVFSDIVLPASGGEKNSVT